MKNFSSIDKIETGKDQLIKELVISTGLPKERIEKLYESFSYENNGDLAKINESFSSFISPESSFFNFEAFKKEIIDLSQQIINPRISLEEREKITEKMFLAITNNCGVRVSTTELLEVICYILIMKNPKFEKLTIEFGKNAQQLFESEKIDFTPINVSSKNSTQTNIINAKEDKKLYEGLRDILNRNNKKWGYNYHLDNAYNAINEYLEKEIQEITNLDNVYTVSDNFHIELLKQLINETQIDQRYRYVDVLRTMIPDIQTLVFDLMLLVHHYTVIHRQDMEFLERSTFNNFKETEKVLFSAISSSLKSSKISVYPSVVGNFYDNFQIDSSKINIYDVNLRLNSIIDMVHIIKSCETEFNLRLRKIINKYVTYSFNLLASTEKVILNRQKIR